jgi:MFS family permease
MSKTRSGSGAFVFVFIAVLVDSIGFGIILPVLPSLIMTLAHVNVAQAAEFGGWLAFVYALMQFFCAPVLGNLSDRFGRRPVLLFALLALGIDYLIMGSAPIISWLFVGRMVAGMAGASFTPAYAYIADITPPAAAVGMAFAILAYVGYAFATQGWMMYVVSASSMFFAMTYPSLNALMSQQIPHDAQGELQGAVASVYSLSAILGPPLMTQVFGLFSRTAARIYFPGAPFLAAALLTIASAALFARAMRLSPRPLPIV